MKAYDPTKPLIHLHIPKTGGLSVREIYQEWFGNGLLLHYMEEVHQVPPERYDLDAVQRREGEVCVYGHFNKQRGFGVMEYYPAVDQFITILRDPFDLAVSAYFYKTQRPDYWRNSTVQVPEGSLKDYLSGMGSIPDFLRYFPREVTQENFREMFDTLFVEVGVLEHLEESMRRIAAKLNKPFQPGRLNVINASERTQAVPEEMREAFREANPLLYAVYDVACSFYT